MRVGLVERVLLSAGIPALLAVAAFGTMAVSTVQVRHAQSSAAASQALVLAAGQLSRAVGAVTVAGRDVRLGRPTAGAMLDAADQRVDHDSAAIQALATLDREQQDRAAQLAADARNYAAQVETTGLGNDRIFIGRLNAFLATERDHVAGGQHSADAATRRAIVAAGTGLIASIIAVFGLGWYLTRAVTLPVRHAAEVAREFADGNLAARLSATGTGEIGDLQNALNDMAGALAAAQAELAASRARIVTATWHYRRELERNLHDGLQQRLVALHLDVRALGVDLPEGADGLRAQVEAIGAGLTGATEELREIARGIQPAVLTESGLRAALRALARRSALPVEVDVDLPDRPPPDTESAAYYFSAEAVTNAIKHARATYVGVDVRVDEGRLRVKVSDDGVGGATIGGGSGLVGLRDRIEAAGGRMSVESEPGAGTVLTAYLPVG